VQRGQRVFEGTKIPGEFEELREGKGVEAQESLNIQQK